MGGGSPCPGLFGDSYEGWKGKFIRMTQKQKAKNEQEGDLARKGIQVPQKEDEASWNASGCQISRGLH